MKVRPLCEVWDGCGPFGNVGVLVGGMLGAKAGADVSKWTYTKIFGTWTVLNVEDALETCYNVLGVTPQHTWCHLARRPLSLPAALENRAP